MEYNSNELLLSAHGTIYQDKDWFIVPEGITIYLYCIPGFTFGFNEDDFVEKPESILIYTGGDLMFDIHFSFKYDMIANNNIYNYSCYRNIVKSDVVFPFKFDQEKIEKLKEKYNNNISKVNLELFNEYCIDEDLKDIMFNDNENNCLLFYLSDVINKTHTRINYYHIFSCTDYYIINDNIYPYGFNKDPEKKIYCKKPNKIIIPNTNIHLDLSYTSNSFSMPNVIELPNEVIEFFEKRNIFLHHIIIYYINKNLRKILYTFVKGYREFMSFRYEYKDYEFSEVRDKSFIEELNNDETYEKILYVCTYTNLLIALKNDIIFNKKWEIRRSLSIPNSENDAKKEKLIKQVRDEFKPINIIKIIKEHQKFYDIQEKYTNKEFIIINYDTLLEFLDIINSAKYKSFKIFEENYKKKCHLFISDFISGYEIINKFNDVIIHNPNDISNYKIFLATCENNNGKYDIYVIS
jgi:hypothetical protein